MKINEIIDSKNIIQREEEGEDASKSSQLSFLKLSDEEIVEFIRPEFNLEKWQSFLFPHPKAQGLDEERSISMPITLPDGREATGKITVTPAVGRNSTTSRSYDVYLALIAIWDSRGLPDEPFETSIREIVKAMGVPENGKWYEIVLQELEILFMTTTTWVMTYVGEKKYESVKYQKSLDVFAYSNLNERADQSDKFQKVCMIQLSERIRENHIRNNTNPILWSVRKSIRSPVARVFYSQIDRILYNRPRYERTGMNIVTDLMLSPERYKYKSKRLELLQKLQKQLDGKTLSNLCPISLYIAETADGNDFKVIVSSGASKAIAQKNTVPVLNTSKQYIDMMVGRIDEVVGGANTHSKLYRKLVRHYTENHIMRALGEYKEARQYLSDKTPEYRQKHFTVIMHRLAHSLKRSWIKACPPDCKHDEQNRLL